MCFLRLEGWVYDLSHPLTLQLYGLSDVWTWLCFLRSLELAKRRSQPSNSHLNGFSPEKKQRIHFKKSPEIKRNGCFCFVLFVARTEEALLNDTCCYFLIFFEKQKKSDQSFFKVTQLDPFSNSSNTKWSKNSALPQNAKPINTSTESKNTRWQDRTERNPFFQNDQLFEDRR